MWYFQVCLDILWYLSWQFSSFGSGVTKVMCYPVQFNWSSLLKLWMITFPKNFIIFKQKFHSVRGEWPCCKLKRYQRFSIIWGQRFGESFYCKLTRESSRHIFQNCLLFLLSTEVSSRKIITTWDFSSKIVRLDSLILRPNTFFWVRRHYCTELQLIMSHNPRDLFKISS